MCWDDNEPEGIPDDPMWEGQETIDQGPEDNNILERYDPTSGEVVDDNDEYEEVPW